jgi:hypothetical protein
VKQIAVAFGVGAATAVVTSIALTMRPTEIGAVDVGIVVIAFSAALALSGLWGVFGREFAMIGVAWCGAWTAWSTGVLIRFFTDDTTDLLVGSIAVLALSVGGFVVTFVAWMIGQIVCVSTGHHTSKELSEIATGRPDSWVSVSGQTLPELFDEVERLAPRGEPLEARSMGIEHRRTWKRPVAIVATRRTLIVAPINADGLLRDDVAVISPPTLTSASVRSLDRTGATRRSLSHHDDVIEITTVDGRHRRLTLAYEPRRRPTSTEPEPEVGAANAVRRWIRVNATTYH